MNRRKIRDVIFKILFKLEFNSVEEMTEQLEYTLADIEDISDKDVEYITDKVNKIISLISNIDEIIVQVSEGWALDRIGKAELAIIRLAIYEMKYEEDMPFSVAINEAVELSKTYCNEDTKRFVNGILAKVEE